MLTKERSKINPEKTRKKLIEGTIKVIAENGMDKASTKLIGKETELNEVYIYRCFKDKGHLLACAFDTLDEEFVTEVMRHLDVWAIKDISNTMRCRMYFNLIWRFLLHNSNRCTAYMQYYYSPYFLEYSFDSHIKRYAPLMEIIKPVFLEETNVWMIWNHIINVLLNFSLKVFSGAVPDNDDTEEHVFRLIHSSVRQYFKNDDT